MTLARVPFTRANRSQECFWLRYTLNSELRILKILIVAEAPYKKIMFREKFRSDFNIRIIISL